MRQLRILMAHGFGLGLAPVASGTFGTLLGLPLAWGINTVFGVPGQIACAVVLSLFAIWVCNVAEAAFGKKDPGQCVADEYLTFPISMIGLPVAGPGWLVILGIAFVSNRFFDIVKIWPARGLQRLPSGLGIVIDDVFAAAYSLAFNHAAWWALHHFGWL
jgi:phosphatidylglycerophosphatase A